MKAIVRTGYGPPDILKLEEVHKPTPAEDEVLVQVHAASVNPLDWHFLRGTPFLARVALGPLKPKVKILGADFAGRVEAVGRNAKRFQPGDEVFGDMYMVGLGSFAEYVSVTEDAPLVLKPAGITFEEAAAVPAAGVSALQGLRDMGQIQPGQKVLVNGASGGVGTFAVQIAKSYGAEVTGVCSTGNLDLVRSIGADRVIDYTREDFTHDGECYDLILDAVGNRSASDLKSALHPRGICVIIGLTSLVLFCQHLFHGQWISRTGSKKIVLMGEIKSNARDLEFMKKLLESGKVVPVVDRRHTLSQVAEAIRYLEKGHARGKVVINVEHHDKA
jgi:NADPH:quinone reductase-like Zn-dependent oxidoreductase